MKIDNESVPQDTSQHGPREMPVRIIEPLDRETELRAGGWGTETLTTFYLLLETPEAPGVEITASFRHYDLDDPDYPDFRAGRTMRIEARQDADILDTADPLEIQSYTGDDGRRHEAHQ
jgi:hypothetical protein